MTRVSITKRNVKQNAYSPFGIKETRERYLMAVRQLKHYPHSLELQDEIKRYGKFLKYSVAKIERDLGKKRNPTTRKTANPQVLRTYVTPEKMRMSDLLGSLKNDYRVGEVIEVWYKDVRYTWQKSGANSWKKLSGTPKKRRNASTRGATSGDSRTEVRSPTRTATSTEAHTSDNITVTGGAGAGATTSVTIRRNARNPTEFIKGTRKVTAKYRIGQIVYDIIDDSKRPLKITRRQYLIDHWEYFAGGRWYTEDSLISKKGNPELFNGNRLDELSATFQGEITGKQIKSVGSNFVPNVTARIGQLSLMKIRNGGDLYELKFKRNGDSWLAMDARKNLHIIGRDTIVKNAVKPKQGQLTLLGELEQINYITAKRHIENGRLTEYYHQLGEVDGIKPNVFMDHEGFMIINGGGYDIGVNGVEN